MTIVSIGNTHVFLLCVLQHSSSGDVLCVYCHSLRIIQGFGNQCIAVTYVSRNVNWSVNKACSICELEIKVYKAKGQYNQYSPILTACTWGVFEWPEAECPVKMMQHKKYVNLTETAQTVEIHVEYSRSCRGRVVKTSDFYTGGPRLKSWLGSSTVGQGTLSSLPCLSENLSRRSIVYNVGE